MEEIWKDIPGYEGLYQVSDKSCVRSLDRFVTESNFRKRILFFKGQIIKPYTYKNGYYYVVLRKDGGSKHFYLHRLVANAFIPNPYRFPFVNHKDENPSNNNIENLEWCTHEYNMNYGTVRERMSKHTQNNAKRRKVSQFTLSGDFVKTYKSLREAQKMTGICYQSIGQCCLGNKKYSHAGGFVWKYV